ncbi:463_t:CDS:2, partial [Gigaspora margarita]
ELLYLSGEHNKENCYHKSSSGNSSSLLGKLSSGKLSSGKSSSEKSSSGKSHQGSHHQGSHCQKSQHQESIIREDLEYLVRFQTDSEYVE